ncbi:protein of unknown function [Kyrpidia spormannii]|uniref:Uncharacterized protein n=1 Tax=Kyrpidia spormannii TaxID=2055160 RepID=A0A6F9EH85_9BACL|nr:protein of unknown function [Kyrpidia spormannii]
MPAWRQAGIFTPGRVKGWAPGYSLLGRRDETCYNKGRHMQSASGGLTAPGVRERRGEHGNGGRGGPPGRGASGRAQ